LTRALPLLALALVACGSSEPPLEEAGPVARSFVEAFASGRYLEARRLALGDVANGVEVQRRAREDEGRAHPAEIALLEKAMRRHPPEVEVRPPRRYSDHVEVTADVTTIGPHGPERARYTLSLVWRGKKWRVYRWER
jgi:hypothetical protein